MAGQDLTVTRNFCQNSPAIMLSPSKKWSAVLRDDLRSSTLGHNRACLG